MSALRKLFRRLFARRTIIVTETHITINGRDATPEETVEVRRTLDRVNAEMEEMAETMRRYFEAAEARRQKP